MKLEFEQIKYELDMRLKFQVLSSALALIGMFILSCDDRLKHIDAWGTIIMQDQCAIKGRQSWIVDLDMQLTTTPNTNIIIPVVSDTVNGKRYNNLIRVLIDIKQEDTISISKGDKFNFKVKHELRPCSSNRSTLSSYSALSNEYIHVAK